MKKGVIIFFILVMLPCVAASSVDEEISSLIYYAEQYELGNINYLELKVQTSLIRENVNSLLGSFKWEEHGPSGITAEAAESYFGQPREYTTWVWDVTKDEEIRMDEEVPWFEKIIFDGKRVQITFNAWPHLYSYEGEETLYYWSDFRVHFKKDFDINKNQMISEIKSLGEDYYENGNSGQELAEKMSIYRGVLDEYVQENPGSCEDLMDEFFSSEDLRSIEDRIRWKVDFYQGDNLDVMLTVQMPDCSDDCQWPWVDFWFEPRFLKDMKHEGSSYKDYDGEKYKEYSIEELNQELKDTIEEAKSLCSQVDKGKESWGEVESLGSKMRAINEALSEKYYWGKEDNSESFDQRKDDLQKIFSNYNYDTESLTETRYENRLVINEEMRQDSWCREVGYEKCEWGDVCMDGECTNAIGGNEICDNQEDDDADTAIDCEDPDCAVECGRVCEPVCEDECWSCYGESCQNTCQECWDCDWETEDCESICQDTGCNPCMDNCRSQDFCAECNACEGSQQPEGECEDECGDCNSCIEEFPEDPNACEEICEPCAECQKPKNYECYDKCEEVSEGMIEAEACKKMCDDNVVFYCGGSKQYVPCDHATYICGGNMQNIPCMIYTCKDEEGIERKQTVMCGEEHFCGENQKVEDDKCVCENGYYDCDGDGSCESETSCSGSQEVCDDAIDNDDDYLVDCQDLADCSLQSCGFSPVDAPMLCYQGKCQEESEIKICEENQTIINGECVDLCVTYEECGEGYICQYGLCQELITCELDEDCAENEICEENYCVEKEELICVFDTDCNEEEICKDNRCIVIECEFDEDCEENEICSKSECIFEKECEFNENCLIGEFCQDGLCMGIECPIGMELQGSECISLFECELDEDCTENEVCESGYCIEHVVEKPEETGETCSVAEDCSGERDICSNGVCKEIPEENYNNLIDDGLIEEPEEEPEEVVEEPQQEPELIEEVHEEISGKVIQEPEPEPQEEPEEQYEGNAITGGVIGGGFPFLTGAFSGITGFVTKDEGDIQCLEDNDCNDNQNCDTFENKCHCKRGYFDCNGWGDGQDSDGCESNDVTCGGDRELCPEGCGENQFCSEESGWCECVEGYSNCDGVWWTCDTEGWCEGCESNDECSEPICDQNNKDYVINFGCFEGSTWTEEKGAIAFSGGCSTYNSGRKESYLGFEAWGDPFEKLHSYEDGKFNSWCERELENALKERKEIENSLNQEFLTWLFEEHINDDPENWDRQVGAIFDVYWGIVDNTREITRSSECLDEDYPEINPINIEYESEYGHVVIWEEYEDVDEFDMEIYTPYMQIWIFPPKDFIKQEFQKATEQGKFPGDEHGPGPSPEELEEIRSDPEAMQEIEDLVSKYDDGSLDAFLTVTDNKEHLLNMDFSIDTENLIQMEIIESYTKDPDLTVEIDFDFLYNLIETTEKNMEIEHPEWAEANFKNGVNDVMTAAQMATKITGGISTGKIKVTPISELPTAMKILTKMFDGGGEEERPKE